MVVAQEVREKLLSFITSNFMIDREKINPDKPMIDEGIIDSFGLVEIAGFIEREFKIAVGEEQMVRSNFESVNKIIDFIAREAG